jgi:hypothetical protein
MNSPVGHQPPCIIPEPSDTLQAVFQYEDFNMLWEHATGIDGGPYDRREGIAFIGNNGTLVVDRGGYEVIVEREAQGYSNWGDNKMEPIESYKVGGGPSYLDLHTQNFVQAIKENDPSILNTHISSGSVAAINAQMGNIAYRTGRKVYWDSSKNNFRNDREAHEMISADYQNGWEIPEI